MYIIARQVGNALELDVQPSRETYKDTTRCICLEKSKNSSAKVTRLPPDSDEKSWEIRDLSSISATGATRGREPLHESLPTWRRSNDPAEHLPRSFGAVSSTRRTRWRRPR